MARKEIQRNRLADGDVMLKVQFALPANKLLSANKLLLEKINYRSIKLHTLSSFGPENVIIYLQ